MLPGTVLIVKVFLASCIVFVSSAPQRNFPAKITSVQEPRIVVPYNYGYEIKDPESGNFQNKAEMMDEHGHVHGSFSVFLPDGHIYMTSYTVTPESGAIEVTLSRFEIHQHPSGYPSEGAILLDMDESELSAIVPRVIDEMTLSGDIPLYKSPEVKNVFQQKLRNTEISKPMENGTSVTINDGDTEEGKLKRGSSLRKSFCKILHVNVIKNCIPYDQLENAHLKDYSATNQNDKKKSEEVTTTAVSKKGEETVLLVATLDFLKEATVGFVRLAKAVPMPKLLKTTTPVRFVILLLLAPKENKDSTDDGLFTKMITSKDFTEVAYKAVSQEPIRAALTRISLSIAKQKRKPSIMHGVITSSVTDLELKRKQTCVEMETGNAKKLQKRDPLKRTGRPFYGLIQDVKIRYSEYWSDIRDGFHLEVIASIFFIFFASLSPTITFGGVYADQTNGFIGVGETILVTAINGIIFAIFAAQPLLVVGATGPLMLYDVSILEFCKMVDVDYLSLRAWIGIWMLVIGILVSAFEVVTLVRTFTRYTVEVFSAFVAVIFIYEAFRKLGHIFRDHPLNPVQPFSNNTTVFDLQEFDDSFLVNSSGTVLDLNKELPPQNQPNTALLCMCLTFGTFIIAWELKKFKSSLFLTRGFRRALGNFGVAIGIILMTVTDYMIKDTYTPKLSMPSNIQPSNSDVRGWVINPFGVLKPLPVWGMAAAFPIALLLFFVIFIGENTCHLILRKPENCLKKGTGFHLDIFLSCAINTVSGFLGAPFMVPSVVRTISHMSSLLKMKRPSPEQEPRVVGCYEQRLSGFFVSLLVGLGVMLSPVLKLVPNAVLYGIFLYMGASSLTSIQFYDRFVMYFMPVKYHNRNLPYVKNVKTRKMHLFTALQVASLIILWIVKQSKASLAVSFILMCLVPFRHYVFPLMFTEKELQALDGTTAPKPQEVDEEETR